MDQSVGRVHPTVKRRVRECQPPPGHPPDHHIDGGHHVIPLRDEAVEKVAVEDGPHHSYGGEERPKLGELVLALWCSSCSLGGDIDRRDPFRAGG